MSEENNKVIYTDSFMTKQLIWDAYNGYREHYSSFIMNKSIGRKQDHIITAGLSRYSDDFYNEIKYLVDNFKQISEEDKDKLHATMKKDKLVDADYSFLRDFFNQFMSKSGIKNIIKEMSSPSTSVEDGFY